MNCPIVEERYEGQHATDGRPGSDDPMLLRSRSTTAIRRLLDRLAEARGPIIGDRHHQDEPLAIQRQTRGSDRRLPTQKDTGLSAERLQAE
jgi:hypothetical protein